MRCDQVDDLLRLEAELQLETLRSIKEAEKVMDLWNYALPSLRQIRKQPPEVKKKKNQGIIYPFPTRQKAVA